ncbi:1,2-phenylacetyl-CoA epoxidase subunit PaaC [Cytobacillus purgationiresistens]|nr:1,2-phenylacetyl-CoA epoxidase subunit PaaC [Cytobacillus purgationiresistens]
MDSMERKVLIELLYQLADDDFILAYRGSEWLGLAPHIEEDVAFSSINQDMMGHAAMFYQLLEDLGEGHVDILAHGRSSKDRKNAVLLELVNGPGHYLEKPKFDWAFTVVRHYFYTQFKKIRMESLKNSSYQPLADVAVKVNMEIYYHLLHWKTWFMQLIDANDEARNRMETAVQQVFDEFADVLSYGPNGREIAEAGFIDKEEIITQMWKHQLLTVFESVNLSIPIKIKTKSGKGREGFHTDDLAVALSILSEVYHIDPAANW